MYTEVLLRDTVLMELWFNGGTVHVRNLYGAKHVMIPYISRNESEYDVKLSDVLKFFEHRCVPRTREGIEDLLKYKYHLESYSPVGICRQTHGVMHRDFLWLRFDNEALTFDDVRVR